MVFGYSAISRKGDITSIVLESLSPIINSECLRKTLLIDIEQREASDSKIGRE
jgi:uncharacterized Fe-S cluster-containing MiaB family protein